MPLKEKQYKFIGIIKENKRYFAYQNCPDCYGKGYIGRDIKRNIFLVCKCLRFCKLPINWVILDG